MVTIYISNVHVVSISQTVSFTSL